jgi:hypothetical protein
MKPTCFRLVLTRVCPWFSVCRIMTGGWTAMKQSGSRSILLEPYEPEEMEIYEANPKVGNVRNNGSEMLKKALHAAESGTLPL